MLNIAIIGCGYVGKALAGFWKKNGNYITGTTRSPQKISSVLTHCQKAEILDSSDLDKLTQIVNDNDIIVLTVAADNPEDYENAYLQTAKNLKKCATNTTAKKLLYTSSTFIYGDHFGKWVDENSPLLNNSEPSDILIETEKKLLSIGNFGWDILIFRLSEIYGPERSLLQRVKKYQGKTLSGSGQNYTNMIHLDDIVSCFNYGLKHQLSGIYNLTDDDNQIRSELYKQIAEKYNLKKIKWDPTIKTLRSGNKRVSNHKIKASGYSFIHPSRVIS